MEDLSLGANGLNFNYIKENCYNGVLCTTHGLKILLSVDPFGARGAGCAPSVTLLGQLWRVVRALK